MDCIGKRRIIHFDTPLTIIRGQTLYVTSDLTIVDVGVFVLFVVPRAIRGDLISLPLRDLLAGTEPLQTFCSFKKTS